MGFSGAGCSPARTVFAWVLLVTPFCAATGAEPVFPSDAEDPMQAGGAELLETVCPGRVASGTETKCRGACPKFTSFAGDNLGWSLSRLTHGHFRSPTSEDAALWMEGCEPHSENFGGTILMTRRSGRWIMLWYKAGVVTERCHKVPLVSGREVLVCIGTYGAQGANTTELYIEDLLRPTLVMMAEGERAPIFYVVDDTLTCGEKPGGFAPPEPRPVTPAIIERVEFAPGAMSVVARAGRRQMKPEDVKACIESKQNGDVSRFFPATRQYRIDFNFDGRTC
jgi:hypothetical protein